MAKIVESICESCDSEFSLTFTEGLVKEHDEIFCPFCKKPIYDEEEDNEEPPSSDYDFNVEDY